jgi:hypothetical protein
MSTGRLGAGDTAIQPTIFDAKGDLLTATAGDTPARLAVGNNGETLVADSSTSTGLRWQPNQAAGRNAAINGGQDIWQRGTSFTTTAAYVYCSDRWYYSRSAGNTTVSRQTDAPTGFNYSIRLARNSGDTNTSIFTLHTALETAESLRFAGQTVTFSFWAKAGANYTAGAIPTYINTGTGTDQAASGQNAGTWTGFTSPVNGSTFTPTTSWVRYSFTATIGSTATQIGFGFLTNSFSGTAGANDWVQFTGFQFELGSVATTFTRSGGTLAGELAACQRYYFRTTAGSNETIINCAFAGSTTTGQGQIQFPVPMRVAPTSLDSATVKFSNYAGSSFNMTSVLYNQASTVGAQVYGTISGATAGHVGTILGQTTGSYIGLSAEL